MINGMRGTHIFMLVLGIGLGMLLSSLRTPSPIAPLSQPVTQPVLNHEAEVSPPAAPSVLSTVDHENTVLRPFPDLIPKRTTLNALDPEEQHRFQWEENLIAQMESEWEDLPRYAVAEETAEGWRVHLTPEDRLFVKVGLKSGDLITHEGIRAELADPARAPLANRISAILSHIQQ